MIFDTHCVLTTIHNNALVQAIRIGGEWFRISSAIRDDLPLDKQPPRAQAPLSVVSMKDLSKKNEVDGYTRKFDEKTIPIDGTLNEDRGIRNLEDAKHAREKLHSIAGGGDASGTALRSVTGGPCSVLLSSFASELLSLLSLEGYRFEGNATIFI
jgi:hypothetical protein